MNVALQPTTPEPPMNQQIYWHTTTRMPDDTNLTPLPENVDVAVIGGG